MSVDVVQAFANITRFADDFLYVLLDPLAGGGKDHPLDPGALAERLGEASTTRLPHPGFAHASDAAPTLVTLAAPGAAPDAALIGLTHACATDDEHYRKRYVCGWLASPLPPDTLASHLISLCEAAQTTLDGSFTPLYEPPRLELWAAALPSGLATHLWPIRHWLYPVSWGGFALFSGSPGTPADLPVAARETQSESLLVRDVLAAWRQSLHTPMSYAPWRWRGETLLPPQAAARAFRMIRDARRLGLHSSEDIIVLALHRVTVHPDLPDNERVCADIARAAKGEARLQTLFDAYDDAAWRYVASLLPHAKDYP
ncbi:hypothetical protein G3N59_31980 [Paraburkholderia sp. Ac-20340]|uniref:DUF4123 domain-containing protein n=1 Tax=Paraburkholderia sp. Ac-20340 TaxID=2703888 RepID=UPI00197DC893|nr:DUF4123 domain-containing protein [Paraburkholderia sp. Ac-20340]MBN3858015.1 hypothetical protein [Paraburkholderia sp. Ac-20340]